MISSFYSVWSRKDTIPYHTISYHTKNPSPSYFIGGVKACNWERRRKQKNNKKKVPILVKCGSLRLTQSNNFFYVYNNFSLNVLTTTLLMCEISASSSVNTAETVTLNMKTRNAKIFIVMTRNASTSILSFSNNWLV